MARYFLFMVVLNSEAVIQRTICILELTPWQGISLGSHHQDKYIFDTELQMLKRYSNLPDVPCIKKKKKSFSYGEEASRL